LLTGSGFHPVYNLAGGMNAWEGSAAEGPMEMGMAMIRGDESPGEIIRTAHMMEKALGDFYRFCAGRTRNPKVAALFELLEKIEKKHQGRLEEMARLHAVDGIGAEASPPSEILEGGFEREDFLKRVDAYMEAPLQIMEIAMMMEAQALDLYLRFSQKVETSEVKKILFDLADEEKGHLKRLGTLMDELLNG
jgi:rubrerythrin